MAVSVLFQGPKYRLAEGQRLQPDFFTDLNFDQIVAAITAEKEEYNLTPFFYMPLHTTDAVVYRQEVLQDLASEDLQTVIKDFADGMREVRDSLVQLTKKDYYERQKERWFLDAASRYIATVQQLGADLKKQRLVSRGLLAFRGYLEDYIKTKRFTAFVVQTKELEAELDAIRYEVLIEGLRVEVRRYNGEPNYSTEVQNVFQRFSQGGQHELHYGFRERLDMNQVEGRILDLVAELYHETFAKLAAYRTAHRQFMDSAIVAFDREIQFYIAYLIYISDLWARGLPFCCPQVSHTSKAVNVVEGFDIALAHKFAEDGKAPITNDFYLKGPERIIVVSGPNQGGKTTFARMFGQLHYLASLGLQVPGSKAQLYLCDTIFTHFEQEEQMTNLRGKLEDDLLRAHQILEAATPNSIILINEIFTSTTLHDAILLSQKIGASIMELDSLCVWITFIDEVASLSEQTVSMVSTVVPNKPAQRTFKVVRHPADGLAYALSIAEKYKLTERLIERRIKA